MYNVLWWPTVFYGNIKDKNYFIFEPIEITWIYHKFNVEYKNIIPFETDIKLTSFYRFGGNDWNYTIISADRKGDGSVQKV